MNTLRTFFLLGLVLILLASFQAKDTSAANKTDTVKFTTPSGKPIAPTTLPAICAEPPFKEGEELTYTVHYGFITGGAASLKVTEEKFGGIWDVFHAVGEGKTTGLAHKFFDVLDIYESYFNVNSNLPLKAICNVREGSYKRYNEDYFNQWDHVIKSNVKGLHKAPENILDMISVFFYIRRVDYTNAKVGDIISVNTYFCEELFPFYIIFKGRGEVSTPYGTFNCLEFVPVVEPGRIFKKNDDMTFWLSDDQNKILVSVKFDLLVGSFKCDLVTAANVKYPMISLMKKK